MPDHPVWLYLYRAAGPDRVMGADQPVVRRGLSFQLVWSQESPQREYFQAYRSPRRAVFDSASLQFMHLIQNMLDYFGEIPYLNTQKPSSKNAIINQNIAYLLISASYIDYLNPSVDVMCQFCAAVAASADLSVLA